MPVVAVRLPSPGYFETARIPFVAGRDFTDADGFGRPRVVIVSENTAKRFFPGQDPIGRHITLTMMTQGAGGDRRRGARGEDGSARRQRGGFGDGGLRAGGAVRLQRLDAGGADQRRAARA